MFKCLINKIKEKKRRKEEEERQVAERRKNARSFHWDCCFLSEKDPFHRDCLNDILRVNGLGRIRMIRSAKELESHINQKEQGQDSCRDLYYPGIQFSVSSPEFRTVMGRAGIIVETACL